MSSSSALGTVAPAVRDPQFAQLRGDLLAFSARFPPRSQYCSARMGDREPDVVRQSEVVSSDDPVDETDLDWNLTVRPETGLAAVNNPAQAESHRPRRSQHARNPGKVMRRNLHGENDPTDGSVVDPLDTHSVKGNGPMRRHFDAVRCGAVRCEGGRAAGPG